MVRGTMEPVNGCLTSWRVAVVEAEAEAVVVVVVVMEVSLEVMAVGCDGRG
ncbi:hypothetical protein E2C01_096940 [Portunus trituberculatus]|uniref:Uncharacterized protein n=1 Tax=Portunus trituberculatus TaxID=210409 RepID=A0A5B7K475_PORTR|nr:hypothetical protein [Portunus trituberculatus]